ncbi:MAG: hypothetical protein U5R06_00910 [candidate division KSB1 bacterium]|nr:hypothetical protein [candidate division KSB1 bacterium]
MSLGELAAFICSYMRQNGISCVLTGGACVTIYSDNKYQSYDLDEIRRWSQVERQLAKFEKIKDSL